MAKSFLFHLDSAPAQKSVVEMSNVHDCECETIDQLPYFPDFVPSDYFLFPNKKKHLAGNQYQTDYNVFQLWMTFLRVKRSISTSQESKHCSTGGRRAWTTEEIMLKNK